MDDNLKRKRESSRLELEKCNRIIKIITAHAYSAGLNGVELEDCAGGFLAKKLYKGLGDKPWTAEEVETIKKQADSYATRYAIHLTRRSKRKVTIFDEEGCTENGPAGQIASKEPGPEEIVIQAEMFERMLAPLAEMTPTQQQLFARRFLDEMRLVDLQEETGRTDNALRGAVFAIRKRLKRLLEGEGMDIKEIAEYQNILDGFHPGE